MDEKYNQKIRDIQQYINSTKAKVLFNDGTEAVLPLGHIGRKGVAARCSTYIKKNNIENAYPYKILEIIEDEYTS